MILEKGIFGIYKIIVLNYIWQGMFKYYSAVSNRYENKAKLKNNWKWIWDLKGKMLKYKTIYHNRDYHIITKKNINNKIKIYNSI